jgi:hypothetical protein
MPSPARRVRAPPHTRVPLVTCLSRAQFVKEFAVPMSPLFVVHHVVSLVVTAAFWAYPAGMRMALLCTVALELGSASQSLSVLDVDPASDWKCWVNLLVMSASNLGGVVGAVWMTTATDGPMPWTLLFLALVFGALRQLQCHANCARVLQQLRCRRGAKASAD